jgi:hypothetical protein
MGSLFKQKREALNISFLIISINQDREHQSNLPQQEYPVQHEFSLMQNLCAAFIFLVQHIQDVGRY